MDAEIIAAEVQKSIFSHTPLVFPSRIRDYRILSLSQFLSAGRLAKTPIYAVIMRISTSRCIVRLQNSLQPSKLQMDGRTDVMLK